MKVLGSGLEDRAESCSDCRKMEAKLEAGTRENTDDANRSCGRQLSRCGTARRAVDRHAGTGLCAQGAAAAGDGRAERAWQGPDGCAGHQGRALHTLTERPTGCTVILVQDGDARAASTCAAARPARARPTCSTRPTWCRSSTRSRSSGGSAYGLDAAQGVMRYLEEHNIGYQVGAGVVPIVPAAILFDLRLRRQPEDPSDRRLRLQGGGGGDRRAGRRRQRRRRRRRDRRQDGPGPLDERRRSARQRSPCPTAWSSRRSSPSTPSATSIDPATGQVVAGVRTEDGKGLADVRTLLRSRRADPPRAAAAGENTTIGLVATNARLTKVQAQKIAQMAHDGFARAISPVAHARRRRHDLRARDRRAGPARPNLTIDRRARRRGDGRSHRARGDAEPEPRRRAVGARARHRSGAVQVSRWRRGSIRRTFFRQSLGGTAAAALDRRGVCVGPGARHHPVATGSLPAMPHGHRRRRRRGRTAFVVWSRCDRPARMFVEYATTEQLRRRAARRRSGRARGHRLHRADRAHRPAARPAHLLPRRSSRTWPTFAASAGRGRAAS